MDSKEKIVCAGSLDNLVVLNSSDSQETIRDYSLGDRYGQEGSHVRRDKRSRAVKSGSPLSNQNFVVLY